MWICENCHEPTESTTWVEVVDVCYGHGRLLTEKYDCEGSQCCHSEIEEMPLGMYKYEWPNLALKFGYIEMTEHAEILEELGELE